MASGCINKHKLKIRGTFQRNLQRDNHEILQIASLQQNIT